MHDDKIKEAFKKVKDDMDFFFNELRDLKVSITELKFEISKLATDRQTIKPTNQHISQSENTTSTNIPTQNPTHNLPLEAIKTPNLPISIGNKGVPTNKPTNQQTNQHPITSTAKFVLDEKTEKIGKLDHLKRVSEIISTLDELKKEVRVKFKKLTNQEMTIYAIIYQLEDQGFLVDYQLLAERANLSEISIRDYVRKIINKGIPLEKLKQDNKKIILSIPENLKKIASLQTIYSLRDL
jgi:hypothetical protein